MTDPITPGQRDNPFGNGLNALRPNLTIGLPFHNRSCYDLRFTDSGDKSGRGIASKRLSLGSGPMFFGRAPPSVHLDRDSPLAALGGTLSRGNGIVLANKRRHYRQIVRTWLKSGEDLKQVRTICR